MGSLVPVLTSKAKDSVRHSIRRVNAYSSQYYHTIIIIIHQAPTAPGNRSSSDNGH